MRARSINPHWVLVALVFGLVAQGSIAQDPARIDTLRAAIRHATADTLRVKALLKLSFSFLNTEPDSALAYGQEAYDLANKLDHPKWKAHSLTRIGRAYWKLGRFSEALAGDTVAVTLYKELGLQADASRAYLHIGQDHADAGRLPEALRYFTEAFEHARQNQDSLAMASSYGLMAWTYGSMGNYPESSRCSFAALRIHEAKGDKLGIVSAYSNIAASYVRMGDRAKALDMYTRCIILFHEAGDEINSIGCYNAIGSIHVASGNYEEALKNHRLALAGNQRIKDRFGTGDSYRCIGELYVAQGEMAEAMRNYELGLDAFRSISNKSNIADLSRRLGICHARLGDIRNARARFREAYELTRELNSRSKYAEYYRSVLALDSAMGDWRSAFEDHKLYITYRDSIDNEQNTRLLTQQQMQYDFDKREADTRAEQERKDIQAQEALTRKSAQRNISIAALGAMALVSIVFLRQRNRIRREKQRSDQLRERAERNERFKHQFLANMSHEIRTPMNAIMGMTGILRRNQHPPEQDKYLDAIAQSSDNLLVILNDILDLSKFEAGSVELEKVPFEVRTVLNNVEDILRFRAEAKGLVLNVLVDQDVPRTLIGDPTRLNQILVNLVGNAVKFTEVGKVNIAISKHERTGNHITLQVDVSDTGIGIPADRIDKIFEEFTQAYADTTRKYGGTGLGLTISKRLAELQGGNITVRSAPGQGSTFTVSIPYVVGETSSAAPLSTDHNVDLRDLRILLAEDNEFNAMVAQDELADAIPGAKVDVAVNGKIAVELARTNRYDVILMDVQMPEMNGYDATRAIRALNKDRSEVPIIAMTANVLEADHDLCTQAGMVGHIPKPFKREELMKAIATAMGG